MISEMQKLQKESLNLVLGINSKTWNIAEFKFFHNLADIFKDIWILSRPDYCSNLNGLIIVKWQMRRHKYIIQFSNGVAIVLQWTVMISHETIISL